VRLQGIANFAEERVSANEVGQKFAAQVLPDLRRRRLEREEASRLTDFLLLLIKAKSNGPLRPRAERHISILNGLITK
jgi:hypothetical protein